MRICVYGAASKKIDEKYIKRVEKLCCDFANRGHNLVFGAGGTGLMGAAARGFKNGNAHIIGVIPTFFKENNIEHIFSECDEVIFTETMHERKFIMEDRADAFVVVPGGIGTFEELFEILTLKQLNRHTKPIVLYNFEGYYDAMIKMIEESVKTKFVGEGINYLFICTDDFDEIIKYIENDSDISIQTNDLKNN